MLNHRSFCITAALLLFGPATLACDDPAALGSDEGTRDLDPPAGDTDPTGTSDGGDEDPLDLEPVDDTDPTGASDDEDEAALATDVDELQAPPVASLAPIDTSESYLDDTARKYLEQAGMVDVGSIGATRWVDACKVMAQQGGFFPGPPRTEFCSWANVLPGWIILDTDYVVLQNKNNRGSASVSTTNGPVTISQNEFGPKFTSAISLANGAGDTASSKKLELEYQRLSGYSFKFDGQGNQLIARATANGGFLEGSRIEIQARARLLRVH